MTQTTSTKSTEAEPEDNEDEVIPEPAVPFKGLTADRASALVGKTVHQWETIWGGLRPIRPENEL